MDDERAETVREWDSRSVEEGHAGLRALSGEGFSGAIEGGRATVFMTNGRIVGVAGGDLDDVEGARLTAYEAPDDALPLLFAMQERGGETRAQYYTEETPLEEVNRTLENGGFTGYVVLSENVLSGDYYVVYHGGKSSSLAFVGNSRRLLTGEEAFERAADEVGIYEVVDAPADVIDLPGAATGGTGDAGDESGAGVTADSQTTPDVADADADAKGEPVTDAAEQTTAPGDDEGEGKAEAETEAANEGEQTAGPGAPNDDPEPGEGPYGGEEIKVGAGLGTADGVDEPADRRDAGTADGDTGEGESTDVADEGDDGPDATGGETPTEPADGDDADADEGESDGAASGDGPVAGGADDGSAEGAADGPADGADGEASAAEGPTGDTDASDDAPDRVATLEATRDRLEADLAEAREELERVREERDERRAEAERLRERVATLERRVEELESDGAPDDASGPSLSTEEALAETNLFVRYRSKSEPTLAAAHDEEADREAVNENLRIEHHTTFDARTATVEGRPFESFLEETLEHRFVRWVVRTLPYELRSTENRRAMESLYDAIPEVDRIELGGEVRVGDDAGAEAADAREFDVVFRNRMGAPLAVANLHESRQPASGEFAETLIEDATAVADDAETVGAAFTVTTSYYEPPALEAADGATDGGFLSRSRRKSYVKLGRNRGFHLCLVEARDDEFNLKVPEL